MSRDPRAQHSKRRPKANPSSGGDKGPDKRPVDYYRLIAAWRTDFWDTIAKMAPHVSVARDEDLKQVDEGANFNLIQSTIGLGLEYIILDIDALSQHGGEVPSFDYGFSCLTDLALKMFLGNHQVENDLCRLPGDLEQNLVQLHACMIALIARGDSVSARELSRMTDELLWIHENLEISGMLKPPYDKGFGRERQQIRLLVALADMLRAGKLPTLKTLRMKVFGEGMDAGNFSRLLKGLEVAKFIPRDTTRPIDPSVSTFHPIKSLSDGFGQRNEYIQLIASQRQSGARDGNLADVEPVTAQYCSIKPSGKPEMAHCEIRQIRESLGAAYWQLLIQFGMGELESDEDLKTFVDKLANIGLELK